MKPTSTNYTRVVNSCEILKSGMRAMFGVYEKAGAFRTKVPPVTTGYAKALAEQKAKRGEVAVEDLSGSTSGDAA